MHIPTRQVHAAEHTVGDVLRPWELLSTASLLMLHAYRVVSPEGTYTLQAESEFERAEWIAALQVLTRAVLLSQLGLLYNHTTTPGTEMCYLHALLSAQLTALLACGGPFTPQWLTYCCCNTTCAGCDRCPPEWFPRPGCTSSCASEAYSQQT